MARTTIMISREIESWGSAATAEDRDHVVAAIFQALDLLGLEWIEGAGQGRPGRTYYLPGEHGEEWHQDEEADWFGWFCGIWPELERQDYDAQWLAGQFAEQFKIPSPEQQYQESAQGSPDIYRDNRTGAYVLVDLNRDADNATCYRVHEGQVDKDSTLISNLAEAGKFPPPHFQSVELADLPGEVRAQIVFDLEE